MGVVGGGEGDPSRWGVSKSPKVRHNLQRVLSNGQKRQLGGGEGANG